MLTGSCSGEVPYSIDRCWELVADIERAPEWQRTMVSVEVVQRDDQGRPLICDTVSDAKLTKIAVRVRMSYEEPTAVRWQMVKSDHLDAMDGSWELVSLGPDRTRATYALAVDPGRIGLLARPLERAIRQVVIGHQAEELAAALSGSS
jgi:ribosome-associated toxin RatA of RatAB toxin-antitoxin module